MLRSRPLLSLGLSLACAAVAWGSGRPLFRVDPADFIEKTKFIFVGRVLEAESYRDDRQRQVFTRYTFQVQEVIKGEPPARLEVIEYGGTVGDLRVTVSHTPQYRVGGEYLVFSYLDLLHHNRTLAGPLGRFQLRSVSGGERLVRLYPSHPLARVAGGAGQLREQKLREFSLQLRNLLDGPRR